jgi:spermidine/putrescine transport system substrate-binding protein
VKKGVGPVLILACLVVSCLLSAVACGKGRPELNVYTWADYINPEFVARFESEHSCRVVIDTFDSNESMYAKLKAGAAGYYVITPSSYMVSLMHAQGMLRAFDHGRLPSLAHVDRDYLAKAVDKTMRMVEGRGRLRFSK